MSSIYWTRFENSNIALKLKKIERNERFFIGKQRNFVFLSRFSGNLVFEQKSAESPPFLRHGTSDRAETFIQVLDSVLGAYFFCFEKYCTVDFWQILQKMLYPKKHAFLRVLPVFWSFYANGRS